MSSVQATLLTFDGKRLTLPLLRSWDIQRTDGDGCDAFCIRTAPAYDIKTLQSADRIQLELDGKRIMTGLVDECVCTLGQNGATLEISGRGYGARLLDNQTPACAYQRLTTDELVRTYVQPYGVTVAASVSCGVESFSVACGNSAMQVVQGFCAHAGLLAPMFNAQGELLLRKRRPTGGSFTQSELLGAVWRDKRYGVISRQVLEHVRTGAKLRAVNPTLLARGGMCERYGLFSGDNTPAVWRNAVQRVEASRANEHTLELTVSDRYPCEPGCTAEVSLPAIGLEGSFAVRQVRSVGSSDGCYAVVSLFQP